MNNNESNNILFVVSGPSGSGKDTLINYVMSERKTLNHSVSATSRDMRPGEKEGVDYYFISSEEFDRLVSENAFIEWDAYGSGSKYGTLYSVVNNMLADGKDVAFDITIPGADNIKARYGENAYSIFLIPPSLNDLKERLVGRQRDSAENIAVRMKFAVENEIEKFTKFDYCIINDKLDDAKKAVLAIYDSILLERSGKELTEDEKNTVNFAEKFKVENCKEHVYEKIQCLLNEDAE